MTVKLLFGRTTSETENAPAVCVKLGMRPAIGGVEAWRF